MGITDSCFRGCLPLKRNGDILCLNMLSALITEEGFLISPRYSLELCIQMGISFLFSFSFHFSSIHSYLQGLLRQPFCFFAFLFLGDGLITASYTMLGPSVHSSTGTLSIRSNCLSLFVNSTA